MFTYLKEIETNQDYKTVKRKSRSTSYGAIFLEIDDTLKEKNVRKYQPLILLVTGLQVGEERIDKNENDEENLFEDKHMLGECREYGHILAIILVVISVIIFVVYVSLGGLNINTL